MEQLKDSSTKLWRNLYIQKNYINFLEHLRHNAESMINYMLIIWDRIYASGL